MSARLRPHPPAVHIQRLPGHEGGVVAGEKRQGADQIVRHLDALDRLQAGDGAEFLVRGGEARARLSPSARGMTIVSAYLTVITRPLRSALTMAPTELPVSVSTAPFGLASTIACAPRPTAAPTLPAA
jgi:hypothetical protein